MSPESDPTTVSSHDGGESSRGALGVHPRRIAEGCVPLLTFEGSAYQCGHDYITTVKQRFPGYGRYLAELTQWKNLSRDAKRLFEQRAPYLLDYFAGALEACGEIPDVRAAPAPSGCTSFSVHGSLTLDGQPISGQNKETAVDSAELYIVLRVRIEQGPTMLVLAYPGELLGYGMWSTGMTLFRNSLHSTAGGTKGLTMEQFGMLALAGDSVEQATETAQRYGLQDSGNMLISDAAGGAVSVEFNAGGVCVVPPEEGITVHANHPVAAATTPYEPDRGLAGQDSRDRMDRLREMIRAERGRFTAQRAFMCLADHSLYPRGICRHQLGDDTTKETTAAIVAEPAKGRLHVVRSHPCANWPVTHEL